MILIFSHSWRVTKIDEHARSCTILRLIELSLLDPWSSQRVHEDHHHDHDDSGVGENLMIMGWCSSCLNSTLCMILIQQQFDGRTYPLLLFPWWWWWWWWSRWRWSTASLSASYFQPHHPPFYVSEDNHVCICGRRRRRDERHSVNDPLFVSVRRISILIMIREQTIIIILHEIEYYCGYTISLSSVNEASLWSILLLLYFILFVISSFPPTLNHPSLNAILFSTSLDLMSQRRTMMMIWWSFFGGWSFVSHFITSWHVDIFAFWTDDFNIEFLFSWQGDPTSFSPEEESTMISSGDHIDSILLQILRSCNELSHQVSVTTSILLLD